MSHCGDGGQGAPASKRQHPEDCDMATTSSKKNCLLEGVRVEMQRAASPVPSCVSMKSDTSMLLPEYFSREEVPCNPKVETQRAASPVPSCMSMKSEASMKNPIRFSEEKVCSKAKVETQRAASPVPSCMSVKSEASMKNPIRFNEEKVFCKPKVETQRAASPVPSCMSMKSEASMKNPIRFREEKVCSKAKVETQRAASPVPSCMSVKSEASMKNPIRFNEEKVFCKPKVEMQRAASPVPSCVSMKSEASMKNPIRFSEEKVCSKANDKEQGAASPVPSCVSKKIEASRTVPIYSKSWKVCYKLKDEKQRAGSPVPSCVPVKSDASLQKPPNISGDASDTSMPTCDHPDLPMSDLQGIIQNHKATLKRKNENLIETITVQETQSPLSMLYTELLITEGDSEGVNEEHEVLQIELSSRKTSRKQISQDVKIHCNYIFRPLPTHASKDLSATNQEQQIKTVLTKGIAGIGKTISVLKFIVDWTEGHANEDVHFMIVFPFRALNLVKDNQYSLHGLLLEFHPELKELDPMTYEQYKTVFIFDGLDESQFQLDFSKELYDVTKISSVGVLVGSLIKGTLCPSAKIWITSRPAATSQVDPEFISRVTEIQGFDDSGKKEYFRRRFSNDKDQFNRIISHMKTSKSLHIMCHIPVFCWILALVFEQIQGQEEIPKTLTEMYIHFLIIQTKIKNKKFQEDTENDSKKLLESNKESLLKLGELALNQLLRGNIIFYDEDLKKCAIDVSDATVYSGICTEIFLKEEYVLHQKKVYCFVHRSVQEFFAALYVFYCYLNKNMKVLGCFLGEKYESVPEVVPLDVLLKKAVDKALESNNGYLDLFIRFLHGISLESNQKLLHGVLPHTESNPESRKKTVKNLKVMQQNNVQPERWINILHCLTEMRDCSVHDDIQDFLQSKMYKTRFTLAHCTALVYMLLMSEEELDEFDLRKYNTSDEGRRRLLPAVRCCRKALFAGCKLTKESCETLASALRSGDFPLRELDLSINDIQDSGVNLLSPGLKNQQSNLQILRLAGCNLTNVSCTSVVSVLQSANSALRELDLSHNNLQDSGVRLLSAGLEDTNCKLEVLRLSGCSVTKEGCSTLASALSSNNSYLKELDLSYNALGDSAENVFSAIPQCQLKTLRLVDCQLTAQSCEAVALVLQSANCPLKELDMSHNDLQDSGVKFLCVGLKNPVCQLQILRLSCCLVTVDGCAFLASALSSNPTHLRVLDLSYNHPTESGVKLLSAKREDSHYQIKLNVDKGGEFRLRPGPKKYVCKLSMDPNTVSTHLCLSEANRKATWKTEKQAHPNHPERFKGFCYQVLCREGLSGRCYWEAEWNGNGAAIGVAYKGINRRALSDQYWTGTKDKSWLGYNDKSWSLYCAHNTFSVRHNNQSDYIPAPSTFSRRVGVYLDWPAGTLSFYSVSPNTGSLTPLYTFHSTFTEPLYPGFWVWDSSVSLCQ
ncbi:uncharacterized protein LOC143132456 isoform X5 [Alosa pseudoharengus]|uniref:uncharacterized protein LOC143132456 isoform X5 n=1 Tax=Alosa pseudoharengus TaxID=34774 RepID=UPI003F8AD207